MLGRLILILLQIAIAYALTPVLVGFVPVPGAFSLFVYAVLCAIVVFLVGVLAALVLRGVGRPGTTKLTSTLVFALIGAAVATWGPDVLPQLHGVSPRVIVIAGAVIGYLLRR